MRFMHRDVEYAMDNDWWTEAGMAGFVPTRRSFRAGRSTRRGLQTFEIPIDEVEPLVRESSSHGVFNDSGADRPEGTARDRVVRILRWFREETPIEPVEVMRIPEASAAPRFRLYHGAHRFYCSIAAGFSHVPAVDVGEDDGESDEE